MSTNTEIEAALEAAEGEFAPVEVDKVKEHIVKTFDLTEAQIAVMRERFSGLTIAGIEDKKGLEAVHAARVEVKSYRVEVEKVRKRLKEDSLAYGRKVDSVAKHFTGLLLEIEKPLEEREEAVLVEKERIKAERQREADAKLQRRVDALNAVGHPISLGELVMMTDTAFELLLATATEANQAREKVRLEAEAALAAKLEAECLEAERKAREEAEARARREAELAEQEKALAARQAEIKAQEEALAAKARAMEQAAREETIRKEAEEKARLDAERARLREEERKAQAAAEEKAKQEAAARRQAEVEAARPDAEKILAVATSFGTYKLPEMSTEAGKAAMKDVAASLGRFCLYIEKKAEGLTK
ncbi:MAG TPA: hypothetical protein VK465_07000 [Fibrobacteria bacterium]|nr:hypothetical protein [Geothrix sp.]HLP41238.1 hypothetical protein [Fibrobacteria bacterium]